MAVRSDGNTEYEANEPTYEEKSEKLHAEIARQLEQDASRLVLTGRYFGTDEARIIAECDAVKSVKTLDLSDNQLADEALMSLFQSPNLEQLEDLNLSINFITETGVKQLAEAEGVTVTHLKRLSMEDNRLKDPAAVALVNSPHFGELEELNLGWNEVADSTAEALGAGGKMPRLKTLILERNYITEAGVRTLLAGTVLDGLEELNLASNKLMGEGAAALATLKSLPNLKILWLTNNAIDDAGAKAIGESTHFPNLEKLYMGRNYFGQEGGDAVYYTKTLTGLKTLVLTEGVETNPDFVNYSRPELLRPDYEEE
ncbi:hypothetical protein NITGR_1050009 [Nitrospina gracilis 3/211]|uniref:Uncharacterized protein n=1 Tax=Nitrospina gracilis (strain 3/211) TaxID=1266370 RepID=M1YVD1_NITG3|nr:MULTISPECIES: hypothetical protein [Nitrospina]MCF8722247.1 Leucine-rich repeat (LRR) protein [Nitrospina sp. Nb-3]CCQ89446.1 hypothetical protein NITGR_1050009 [Nitrospina gracilis 3/211]